MGCGRDNIGEKHDRHHNCVCDVVRAIFDIQTQAVEEECRPCMTNCFLEPLGGIVSPVTRNADTRVFMLITKNGVPFLSFFKNSNCMNNAGAQLTNPSPKHSCTSVFFRVEDIFDDCCATLRVLKPLRHANGPTVDLVCHGDTVELNKLCDVCAWEATDSCITVDLRCFCAVQCIADVNLGICD